MVKLGAALKRSGAVGREQLEQASQRQVLAGGCLDTCLLELRAVEPRILSAALEEASGLPVAPEAALAEPAPNLDRLLPFALAERHGIVPFAQDEDGTHVACCHPIAAGILDEIATLLREPIVACVALEYQVRLAIEKLYRRQASPRFHELAARMGAPVEPPAILAQPLPADPARHLPAQWSRMEALRRVLQAEDRDEAIESLLRHARQAFEFVAAFVVQGNRAQGWDAMGPEPTAGARIEQVVVSLEAPSVFRTVAETHGRYLGPLRSPEDHALLEALGRPVPRSVFVQPITIGERLVALFFGENGARAIPPQRVAQVMIVGHALGISLERMILARKAAMEEAAREGAGEVAVDAAMEEVTEERQASAPAAASAASLERALVAVERFLAARGDDAVLKAMEELRRVGPIAAELLVALLPGEAEEAEKESVRGKRVAHGLLELGPTAIPALRHAAASPLPGKRRRAHQLLARQP